MPLRKCPGDPIQPHGRYENNIGSSRPAIEAKEWIATSLGLGRMIDTKAIVVFGGIGASSGGVKEER